MEKLLSFGVEDTAPRSNHAKGYCTLVCSSKNGKRLVFSKNLSETLELEDMVKVAFDGKGGLWVGRDLPGITESFHLKDSTSEKKVIYRASLIQKIIKELKIDLAEKVSVTFYGLQLENWEGHAIARLTEKEEK